MFQDSSTITTDAHNLGSQGTSTKRRCEVQPGVEVIDKRQETLDVENRSVKSSTATTRADVTDIEHETSAKTHSIAPAHVAKIPNSNKRQLKDGSNLPVPASTDKRAAVLDQKSQNSKEAPKSESSTATASKLETRTSLQMPPKSLEHDPATFEPRSNKRPAAGPSVLAPLKRRIEECNPDETRHATEKRYVRSIPSIDHPCRNNGVRVVYLVRSESEVPV